LTVCVPLVIEDAARNLHTDIIVTSASFEGVEGYKNNSYLTDYEIYLYDFAGSRQPIDGPSKVRRMSVPAMHTTVVRCAELVGGKAPFWGGMRIRLWTRGDMPTYASDLFSAAYVRWNSGDGFDTLHAHPDPPQLQVPEKFFSSMPFPNLQDYSCTLSLFNPYERRSAGRVMVYTRDGQRHVEQRYELPPYGSTLFNLNSGLLSTDIKCLFNRGIGTGAELKRGGSIVVENDPDTVKNFGYMVIRGKSNNSLAAEHSIHQGNYAINRGSSPFGAGRTFRAKGWVYSAFAFKNKTIGGLNLSSRIHLSGGRPLEEELWLVARGADGEGHIRWDTSDDELSSSMPAGFLMNGAIRLKPFQSCELDFETLSVADGFAGGIAIASSAPTSHVLMKIEVRINNWGTSAFSHFRPGFLSARGLRGIKGRGGLVTDYLVAGVRMHRAATTRVSDAMVAVFNMDENTRGKPSIEVFSSQGLVASLALESMAGLACKYFLLSELFPDLCAKDDGPFTLRLTDANAALIMSALHIDYGLRDVAIDHGSDRFSTYIDYPCR